jgi:hypothetical protein
VVLPFEYLAVFAGIYVVGTAVTCLDRLYKTHSLRSLRQDLRAILLRNAVIVFVMMVATLFYLWMGWPLGEQNWHKTRSLRPLAPTRAVWFDCAFEDRQTGVSPERRTIETD